MTTLIIATSGIFTAGMLFDLIYGLVQLWNESQTKMVTTLQVPVEKVFQLFDEEDNKDELWQLPINEPVTVKWDTSAIPF